MRITNRMGAIVAGFALLIAMSATPAGAQEPAKRAQDPSRRVPLYFGKVGLTPEQKESIYKIRAKHQQQIDTLEKQIAELQGQMLAECEKLLTDTQKQLLEQRRHAAAQGRKSPGDITTTMEPSKSSN